jgi:NAD(P)-dependent dehydrogenase (short-subunit alcohol dehydrogenase family)
MSKWTAANIPDLSGKRAVVTGANSGVGFHTALELARRGAETTLACRNAARGERALRRIRERAPHADVELRILDLADLSSIRDFAESYGAANAGLDILINNAGVMAIPKTVTPDGFEVQFATNYLGHFALTGQLLPLLLASADKEARVVTLTTWGVNWWGKLEFDNLQSERHYHKIGAYMQAKMANLVFTKELARRYADRGIIGVAAHPGYARSNVQFVGPRMTASTRRIVIFTITNALLAKKTSAGARPPLYAATARGVEPGACYGPQGPGQIRGRTGRVTTAAQGDDPELGLRLWQESEKLTGVHW